MGTFAAVARLRVAAIWFAFAALLAAALVVSGAGADLVHLAAGTADPAAASAPAVLADPGAQALTPAGVAAVAPHDPAATQTFLDTFYAGGANTERLLPAYRWNTHLNLYSNGGWVSAIGIDNTINGFSAILFGVAGFIWLIILSLLRFVMDSSILTSGASAMNSFSAGLFNSLASSGLVFLVLAVVIVAAIFAVIRSKSTNAFRMVALCLVIVAAMQFMFGAAASHREGAPPPTGSPAWLAINSSSQIDKLLQNLTGGFGTVAAVGEWSERNTDNNPAFNCIEYDKFLKGAYTQATGSGAVAPLGSVSEMWERAYLSYFTTAQYGSDAANRGGRSICHQADAATVSSGEAYQVLLNSSPPNLQGGPPNEKMVKDIQAAGDGKQYEASLLYWQACFVAADGSMRTTPGWDLDDFGDNNGACANWVKNGDTSHLRWDDGDQLNSDASASKDKASGFPDGNGAPAEQYSGGAQNAHARQVADAQATVMALWGHNNTTRVSSGVLAAVVSGVYAYALIPLTVGTLMSELGLILMMMLLPLTLLLLALGTSADKGGGKGEQGKKAKELGTRMGKLTVAFLGSKVVLTAVLFGMVQFMAVVDQLVSKLPGSALTHALVPVIALFLMRYILKATGLGNITSPGGAMAMTTAAAMQSVGEKRTAHKTRTAANKVNSLGDKQMKKTLSDKYKTTQKAAGAAAAAGAVGAVKAIPAVPGKIAGKTRSLTSWAGKLAGRLPREINRENIPPLGQYSTAVATRARSTMDRLKEVTAEKSAKARALMRPLIGGQVHSMTRQENATTIAERTDVRKARAQAMLREGAMTVGAGSLAHRLPITTEHQARTLASLGVLEEVKANHLASLPEETREAMLDDLTREGLRAQFAHGFKAENGQRLSAPFVAASRAGEMMLLPKFEPDGRRTLFASDDVDALAAQVRNPAYALPQTVVESMPADWSQEDKIDFLNGIALDVGLRNYDGSANDAIQVATGIKMSNADIAAEVEKVAAGGTSVLSTMKVDVPAEVLARWHGAIATKRELKVIAGGSAGEAWTEMHVENITEAESVATAVKTRFDNEQIHLRNRTSAILSAAEGNASPAQLNAAINEVLAQMSVSREAALDYAAGAAEYASEVEQQLTSANLTATNATTDQAVEQLTAVRQARLARHDQATAEVEARYQSAEASLLTALHDTTASPQARHAAINEAIHNFASGVSGSAAGFTEGSKSKVAAVTKEARRRQALRHKAAKKLGAMPQPELGPGPLPD